MRPGTIGYNHRHGAEFREDRPGGIGCWVLLFVKSPAVFTIDGRHYETNGSAYILITPYVSVEYGPKEDSYIDDWIYFLLTEEEVSWIQGLGVHMDELVQIDAIDEVSEMVHLMTYEHFSTDLHHELVEEKYFELLFVLLGRKTAQSAGYLSNLSVERNVRLNQLRAGIYQNPESSMTIDEMAETIGLSRSGLQHQYKKKFGISISQDQIKSRLEHSCRLLSSTELTLREIAERCGYQSEFYYMRQFKEHYGKTPGEYRKCLSDMDFQ